MKKFLLKVGLFFLVVVVFDAIAGIIFPYLMNHTKGGDNGRYNYICNHVDAEVLIFGSSRAIHHYNPVMLSDSLGMSCYNCGQDGNGVILSYGRYQLISQRYQPKVVIYDVIPKFDLLAIEDNHKYLGYLRAYYDKKGIPEIFDSVDNIEKYKMLSQMYRYNTKCIQVVSDFINPLRSDGINGFLPINEEMDTLKVTRRSSGQKKYVYDSLKISFVKKMIEESNKTKFVFVVSPFWDGMDTTSLSPIKDICQQHAIPFIDFSNNPKYVHHNEYFKDGAHLNARGADEFTRDLIVELKEMLAE